MKKYRLKFTAIGLAKLANAQVTQNKLDITHMAIGDANEEPYVPTGEETALVNEVWRTNAVVKIHELNTNWLEVEAVIPAEIGGFTINEFGLYDADGDFVAISNHPSTPKPALEEGALMDLTISGDIKSSNAALIELTADPTVITASKGYVDAEVVKISDSTDQKIDEVNTQLAQMGRVSGVDYKANGKGYLKIPVYNNTKDYQATHPSVLHFPSKWNGYKFWMAMTPYEYENEALENPSIIVSNDGVNWYVPAGLTNPLATTPNKTNMHHSDVHLVYNSTLNRLEVWYRRNERVGLPLKESILRRTSTDGITWTTEEVLYSRPTGAEMLSPVVNFIDDKYCIWISNFYYNKFEYFETPDGTNWTKIRDIAFPRHKNGLKPWHMDIKKTVNGYEMYYSAGLSYNCVEICYSVSEDNVTYTDATTVMERMPQNIDEKRLYRPCFVDLYDKRYIYYGGTNHANKWYIGLTTARVESPKRLNGVTLSNQVPLFAQDKNELVAPNGLAVGEHGLLQQDFLQLVKGDKETIAKFLISSTFADTVELKNHLDWFINLSVREIRFPDLGGGNTRRGLIVNNDRLSFHYNGVYQTVALNVTGTTADRPTIARIGDSYYDQNLSKPIWWSGSDWRDATGTIV